MFRFLVLTVVLSLSGAIAVHGQSSSGQQNPGYQIPTTKPSDPPHSQADSQQTENPVADTDDHFPSTSSGESSSKSTQVDIAPPEGDEKDHPDSASAVREGEEEAAPSTVEEFHSWDPHKAAKSVEVGDYYYKLGNYKAALSRYQEALEYKQNDAVANFRTAQCQEKLKNPQDAAEHYEAYLKILPNGPFSNDARKALAKLQKNAATPGKSQ